jgi:uncharacterized membrane protein YdjX (TVP38/TMEM64 family)
MGRSELVARTATHFRELGRLTPLAFVSAILPMAGSAALIAFSYPLSNWLRANWEVGSILYYVGIVLACGLTLLPPNVIGVIAGWSFGFGLGLLVLMSGIVTAAVIGYYLNARIAGERLPIAAAKYPKLEAVYRALLLDDAWRTTVIVFLLRLSFMPFALTNFLMASARVRLSPFVIGTVLGMLPRSTAMVFIGVGLSEFDLNNITDSWTVLIGIGASILSVVFIAIVSRRALDRFTGGASPVEEIVGT